MVPIYVILDFLLCERNLKWKLSLIGDLSDINIVYNFDGYVKHESSVSGIIPAL
jgi:hypothetical protein